MFMISLNVEKNMCNLIIKHLFYILFTQSKKNEETEQTKRLFKSLIYLLGGEAANHVNFMQHMLVSYSSCYF